jgi:hypothetical protein
MVRRDLNDVGSHDQQHRGKEMPRVKITVGDVKCIRQADRYGKDDVYWLANLRHGPSVDQAHTDMAKLIFDTHYDTSLPELLSIGAGETGRFTKNVVYDKDVPAGSYVFGTLHFMERDTPMANYFAKVMGILGIIVGGLIVGALVGFGVGYFLAGLQGAIGGGILVVAAIALVGFFIGATFDLIGGKDNDAHLGGLRVAIGPLGNPPPASDKDTMEITMTPSGRLEVVDAHHAELIIYQSSHVSGPSEAGHKYEAKAQLEVTGGHR